jgi:hypothetical protein|nr:MAG TPA: minor capsid protein [Caudoviricetes sp.]
MTVKKWEKEILLNKTKAEHLVLSRLEKTYKYALEEVKQRVAVLQTKPQTQSVIYQLKYQNALKEQLEEVYNKLYLNSYSTIDEYLKEAYEDSFFSTMYGLHKQNVPLILPFPQDEVVQMTSVSSDGIKLSDKLYSNTMNLARISREEISRGLATGASYIDIARTLENRSEASYKQSKRIVSTEAHRIQEEVQYKTLHKAKDKGADVVKQWDSTLDRKTRSTHIELDGQLREIDQPFKIPSTGATAQYPGAFGIAKEDINCRCVSLQRARWALDKSELTKMVGEIDGMDEDKLNAMAAKLGVDPSDLKNAQKNYINAKNYNEFKKKYQTKAKAEQAKQAAQAQIKNQGSPNDTDSIMKNAKRFDSSYDADKYHTEKNFVQSRWDNDLSENEREGIRTYTSNFYRDMNSALRNDTYSGLHKISKVKKAIDNATSGLQKTLLAEDTLVYRGMGGVDALSDWLGIPKNMLSDKGIQNQLIGRRLTEKAFMSTGTAADSAWSGIKLEVYLPKGTQAMYVDPISNYHGEHEILVQRNSTFEIKEIKTDSKGYIESLVLVLIEQTLP